MASGSLQRPRQDAGGKWHFRMVVRPGPGEAQISRATGPVKNRKYAERLLAAWLRDLDVNGHRPPTDLTFTEFATRYLSSVETRVAPSTVVNYRGMIKRHFAPALGEMRLDKITPVVLDHYFENQVRKGTLSPKTLNNQRALLHAMFKRALKWRLIPSNPVEATEPLRTDEVTTRTFTADEIRAILVTAGSDSAYSILRPTRGANGRLEKVEDVHPVVALFVLIAVLTGCRRNEVLSLTWSRVDFAKGTVTIDRQWSKLADGYGWKRLKSRNRTFALTAEAWQALLDHRDRSPYRDEDDFVFATAAGTPIDGSNMLKWFKRACKDAGIERNVWIHQLRHTLGTAAAEEGLSSLQIAQLLGHRQSATSERYVHLAAGASQERADLLAARVLGGHRVVTESTERASSEVT